MQSIHKPKYYCRAGWWRCRCSCGEDIYSFSFIKEDIKKMFQKHLISIRFKGRKMPDDSPDDTLTN